ncbi:MAG: hypothetical protein HYY65_09010 [Candidatus Tectomicrobia bacterium]|uniref:Uncharacterized protein n=1 Tax=Tectimicrobiota bacterium TaxID=2528274 RepID=A0A932GQ96_UNCTE|nr:hypothetical protein [Candidatus Tectomicrobia bacterium]
MKLAEGDWYRVLAINLTGVFLACRVAGRRKVARRMVTDYGMSKELGLSVPGNE